MFGVINLIGVCAFWGFIGIATFAPLLFVGNAVQAAKTANNYHFRGYYKLKKEHHIKSVRYYGLLALATSLIAFSFFVIG